MTLKVLSLGAGVQSTTLALMAAAGELEAPDCAIFADTQAEPASVYEHLRWLMSPNVLPFPVHIVSRGNLAADGLVIRTSQRSGLRYQKNLIPLFMKAPDGTKGILGRKCTSEYKVREIIKKVRSLRPRGEQVEQFIGISTDEAHRMKPAPVEWITNRWPLIEQRMSRNDCLRWLERNGYQQPPKSACVFCPYHSDREWLRLKNQEPDAFAAAVAWERATHVANERDQAAHGKPFLHASLVPLDQVDLSTWAERGQPDLFGNECEGMCNT